MTDNLMSSTEADPERAANAASSDVLPKVPGNGPHSDTGSLDAGLEAFLRLLHPRMTPPRLQVEPREVRMRIDQAETAETTLRVRNSGRGHLAGTGELEKEVPGLQLSPYRFGLDAKASEVALLTLRIDASALEAGRHYQTAVVFTTNGEPEKVSVPVSVVAANRRERVAEMTMLSLVCSLVIGALYWTRLLQNVAAMFGIEPPSLITLVSGAARTDIHVEPEFWLFFAMMASISIAPALQLSGRRAQWFWWAVWAAAALMALMGLQRAVDRGASEVRIAFIVVASLAALPLLTSISLTRAVYQRAPHRSGVVAIMLTAAIVLAFWTATELVGSQLTVTGPVVILPQPSVVAPTPEVSVRSRTSSETVYWLRGVNETSIRVIFTDRCWVRVRQDGVVVVERTFSSGEVLLLGDAIETTIRFGLPKAATIIVNGIGLGGATRGESNPYNVTIVRR